MKEFSWLDFMTRMSTWKNMIFTELTEREKEAWCAYGKRYYEASEVPTMTNFGRHWKMSITSELGQVCTVAFNRNWIPSQCPSEPHNLCV